MHRHVYGEVVALLALLLACVCVLVPTYALGEDEAAVGRIKVFQVYDVDMSGLANSFTYLVERQEPDAPLPLDEAGAPLQSFSLRRDSELWLEFPVASSLPPADGETRYHYILRPERTKLTDGLYYVDVQNPDLTAGLNVYYLELYVRRSGEAVTVVPLVHVEGFDGPKVTDPGWRIALRRVRVPDRRTMGGSTVSHDGTEVQTTGGATTIAPDGTETTSATTVEQGRATQAASDATSSSHVTTAVSSDPLSKTADAQDLVHILVVASAGSALIGLSVATRRMRGR